VQKGGLKKEIPALPSNFDRYRRGDALVRQELQKLLERHREAGSILTEDYRVRLRDPIKGHTYVGLKWSEILDRAPSYFAKKFENIRNRELYGKAVHEDFVRMNRVRGVPKFTKGQHFVHFAASCFANLLV